MPTSLYYIPLFYIVKDPRLPVTFSDFSFVDDLGNVDTCGTITYSLEFNTLQKQAAQIFSIDSDNKEVALYTEN